MITASKQLLVDVDTYSLARPGSLRTPGGTAERNLLVGRKIDVSTTTPSKASQSRRAECINALMTNRDRLATVQ